MKLHLLALLFSAIFTMPRHQPSQDMPGQSEPGRPGVEPAPMPVPMPPPMMNSGVAILAHDGFLFVVKGDMIYKVDPKTLKVLARSALDSDVESTESHPAPPIQPTPMPVERKR